MTKFMVPFFLLAVFPLQGAQAGVTANARATGCHPEWNKGSACRMQAQQAERGPATAEAATACHPEWSKGRACIVRSASLARESQVHPATAESSVRVAEAD